MRTSRILTLPVLLCALVACTIKPKPAAVIVLPSDRTLPPGITCAPEPGAVPQGVSLVADSTRCYFDAGRVQISKGYLRDIMQDLEACEAAP